MREAYSDHPRKEAHPAGSKRNHFQQRLKHNPLPRGALSRGPWWSPAARPRASGRSRAAPPPRGAAPSTAGPRRRNKEGPFREESVPRGVTAGRGPHLVPWLPGERWHRWIRISLRLRPRLPPMPRTAAAAAAIFAAHHQPIPYPASLEDAPCHRGSSQSSRALGTSLANPKTATQDALERCIVGSGGRGAWWEGVTPALRCCVVAAARAEMPERDSECQRWRGHVPVPAAEALRAPGWELSRSAAAPTPAAACA